MAEPIMIFQIFADSSQISNLECKYGAVTMIPFTGKVKSDLFTGEILPGACLWSLAFTLLAASCGLLIFNRVERTFMDTV